MGGFIITILIAAITGWVVSILVKETLPGDAWGVALAALVGSWIGAYMPYFNTLGPKIWDLAIVPAFIAAICAAVIMGVLSKAVKQMS